MFIPSTLLNSLSKLTKFFIPNSFIARIILESVKLNLVFLLSEPTYVSKIAKVFSLYSTMEYSFKSMKLSINV